MGHLTDCLAAHSQASKVAWDVNNRVDDLSIDMFSRGEGHRVVCGGFVNMKPLRSFDFDQV